MGIKIAGKPEDNPFLRIFIKGRSNSKYRASRELVSALRELAALKQLVDTKAEKGTCGDSQTAGMASSVEKVAEHVKKALDSIKFV
jgi:hypothetical protein